MGEWDDHVQAWSNPPVDDVGYFSSEEMLRMNDQDLKRVMVRMRHVRYGGWRNHGGAWRRIMGLDSLHDKEILDFGCGNGVEALELALAGNRVSVADISQANVDLAEKVMRQWGVAPARKLVVGRDKPFWNMETESLDVFYCNGVLHHIRWARQIMERAHEVLKPGGEARLMLYSDIGWKHGTGTEPPVDTENDPGFKKFVRHFDAVGEYADWYDRAKIEANFGDLFDVEQFEYITPERIYLAAVLRRK